MKNQKVLGYLVALLGAIFCLLGTVGALKTFILIKQHGSLAQGVVGENRAQVITCPTPDAHDCRRVVPQVTFTDKANSPATFQIKDWYLRKRLKPGQTVAVVYFSENLSEEPRVISFESLYLRNTAQVFFGGALLLAAFGLLQLSQKRHVSSAWLREHGLQISAPCIGIVELPAHPLLGRFRRNTKRYRVRCQWQDPATGQTHLFEGPPLDFHPGELILRKELTLFLHPHDYTSYLLDIPTVNLKVSSHAAQN